MEDLYKTVEEIPDPIEAQVTGTIPDWIDGSLYRNGPGRFEFGDTKFNHWFDGMALLHRFKIKNGKVTYHNKFLQSDTYMRNKAANKIVVSEFGTVGYPDPCKNIFQRFFSYFSFEITDNNMVNVYPIGDSIYAATEMNYLIKVDADTLDRSDKVDISKYVAVNSATAHPHIEPDGTVFNLGSSYKGGLKHNIVKFTPPKKGEDTFVEKAEIVATVPAQNPRKPSYFHSFAITENYFIMLEQPLVFNTWTFLMYKLRGQPFNKALEWVKGQMTRIQILDRKTGEMLNSDLKYQCDPVLCFHHMNSYEKDGYVTIDFCATDDDTGLTSFEMENLQKKNAKEFIRTLPLSRVLRLRCPVSPSGEGDGTNFSMKENVVTCKLHRITEERMDFPQINYMKYNGKPYKYGYGAGKEDVLFDCLKKVNVDTGETLTWYEEDCYPSEPVFVPHPEGASEDHGMILSVVLTTGPGRHAFLLVLDAQDFKEVARARIEAKLGRDTHGYFQRAT